MRSMFVKILLWFWLATALVTMTHIVADMFMGPDLRDRFINHRLAPLGTAIVNKFEQSGRANATDQVQDFDRAMNMRIYLFDQQGNEILGRDVPDDIRKVALNPSSANSRVPRVPRGLGPPRAPEFATANIKSDKGVPYLFVAQLRHERGFSILPDTRTRWGDLIAGLIVAGILCYWLARHLSAPVVKLRAATQQLAKGDLKARVGISLGKRRDELADMGRDFDVMAERIESLMISQRRLLHDISHELRSPLARLGVALELARQGDPEETYWALDRIQLESERLNQMVGQVLTLARLENGGATTDRAVVDLAEMVLEVATDADFEAGSRNRSVKVLRTEPCRTDGSPLLLHSAIENVVRNAVLYTREHTTVEVELKRETNENGEQAVITVHDHGAGVPEVALADIFRPFYRVADARDRESGGTGLGLSITQRAVQLHGGIVKATNVIDGGLLVEIRLPLNPSQFDED